VEPAGRRDLAADVRGRRAPALFVLYIRRNVGESERWLAAIREQRWNATEGSSSGGKRPFTLAEIFREPESRRRVLLTFLLSLATTVGWWAVANLLDRYTAQMAKAAGYADPVTWGTWASLLYTVGAIMHLHALGFDVIAHELGERLHVRRDHRNFLRPSVRKPWTSAPARVAGYG
jgi:hypothetical protein